MISVRNPRMLTCYPKNTQILMLPNTFDLRATTPDVPLPRIPARSSFYRQSHVTSHMRNGDVTELKWTAENLHSRQYSPKWSSYWLFNYWNTCINNKSSFHNDLAAWQLKLTKRPAKTYIIAHFDIRGLSHYHIIHLYLLYLFFKVCIRSNKSSLPTIKINIILFHMEFCSFKT